MPSLKSIKKRISSVKSTQKITKAMKMVAAAKLRRAQQAAVNARQFTEAVSKLTERLAQGSVLDDQPLLTQAETISKKEYLVFTSDRGLCGGFNGNLLRRLEDKLEEDRSKHIRADIRVVGRRGRDYFQAKKTPIAHLLTDIYDGMDRRRAEELAQEAILRFEARQCEEIWLVFNFFKSTLVQEVTFKRLLPLSLTKGGKAVDTIFEPNAAVVLDRLLREYVVARTYEALLESVASELASRMTAMDSATKNASEMIDYLTLVYNRVRQASITKELMDIVNGAEALQ